MIKRHTLSTRRIAVVTTSRADYGIYRPILKELCQRENIILGLFVTGTHLLLEYGSTESEIFTDGYPIAQRFPVLVAGDSPRATAQSMGLATLSFAEAIENWNPDILVVLGDRFEMHSAAVAAQPFHLPIAHIHGGEVTYGAIDDSFRHSMSKLSHLHFSSTQEAKSRLVQMGESAWRITVSGAPGLDSLLRARQIKSEEFLDRYGIPLADGVLLVTYHPPTRDREACETECRSLVKCLNGYDGPVLITGTNADPKGDFVRTELSKLASNRENIHMVPSLGVDGYATVLRHAVAMIGNSSSGLIEAPSFELPVVNLGRRQDGRQRAGNVIDVPNPQPEAVETALNQAMSPLFRSSLLGMSNPYGDGYAGHRIGQRLSEVPLDQRLLRKEFITLANSCPLDS